MAKTSDATAQDHRARHARVQARRTQERAGRQRREGKEPPPSVAFASRSPAPPNMRAPRQTRQISRNPKRKEARGRTAQQETEGKSHVGARGRPERLARHRRQSMRGRTPRRRSENCKLSEQVTRFGLNKAGTDRLEGDSQLLGERLRVLGERLRACRVAPGPKIRRARCQAERSERALEHLDMGGMPEAVRRKILG